MQSIYQELQYFIAENQKQWLEQTKKDGHINL